MMRWEVREHENGKWGIYLCEEFWRYPDKPVCYGESVDFVGADQRVKWMNENEEKLEAEEPEAEESEEESE
jgi:hypothetical protein